MPKREKVTKETGSLKKKKKEVVELGEAVRALRRVLKQELLLCFSQLMSYENEGQICHLSTEIFINNFYIREKVTLYKM